MAENINAPELEFTQINRNHGTYAFYKLLPTTGSQNVTLTTSGGNETLFEVPAETYNFARSYLSFTLTPSASGVGNYNWLFCDTLGMIRTIEFYSRSGVYVIRVNDVNKYLNMLWRHETKSTEMLNYDGFSSGNGFSEGMRSCNCLYTDTGAKRPDGDLSQTSYLEPKYLLVGTSNAATPVVKYNLKLSRLLYTFFALDKDTFFNTIMTIRIVWAPTSQVAFFSDSATDPTSGDGAYAQTMAITNLCIMLAKEKNQLIDTDIKAKVLGEGLNIMIPFVWADKQNLSTATQNISLKYDQHNGQRLMKVFHSAYDNTESGGTCYDRDNLADAMILSYYDEVDNERQTQYDIDTSNYDDYLIMRESLGGSCIFSNDEFYYNYLNVLNFCEEDDIGSRKKIQDNYIDGKPLNKEIKVSKYMTTANRTLNHYTYAICLRQLSITANGPFIF